MKEDNLEALDPLNGKANNVVKGIIALLGEYNLWKCIKVIIVDTTIVNT